MRAATSRRRVRIVRFFEPYKHLRCGDRPFRQMRIERARGDIWRVDQFRSREFLGLSLVRKCFGRPCVRSLSPWLFKRDVPRALGLISHDVSRDYAGIEQQQGLMGPAEIVQAEIPAQM